MLLGSSGVTHPPLQTVGQLTGNSASDGEFSTSGLGYGQLDYDSSGRLYVMDTGNNRVQRFTKNSSGIWAYDSKATTITTSLGGGTNPVLLAIDRAANEIHLAAYDQYVDSTWIKVFSLSGWPTLGAAVRSYGSNANSNTAGKAYLGLSLTIDGTYAVVTSYNSPSRLLCWNHLTGSLVIEETQAAMYAQFATDGAGNWWCSGASGAAEAGIHKIDVPTAFTSLARLDTATVSTHWRAQRLFNGQVHGPFYYSGKVFMRDGFGRILGFDSATGAYRDTYLSPGGLEPNGVFTGDSSGQPASPEPVRDKGTVIVDGDGCAWFACWQHAADNTAVQSYLGIWPLSSATATWTKTDWSSGTNTIKAISLKGTSLSGEKFKIRLKKNSGAWTTITPDLVQDEATLDFETFTSSDTLTVELSLSTWDRLDGHATLTATRDKLSPSEVAVQLVYEDTEGDVYVPYATAGFKARQNATGAFKARQGE